MDHETIKRLLIDRAIGELSADAQSLLDDYLANHAKAHREASAISETVALTRQALDAHVPPAAGALPAFPARRIDRALAVQRQGQLLRPLALAAVVAFAFWIGRISPPASSSAGRRAMPGVASSTGSDIWSVSAERLASHSRRDFPSNPIHWSSPLRWPLEDYR